MADLMIQFDSGRIYEHAEEIATMLRQQHAEIEALKQIIDANNLNQNIGQFVKPTNEPVAWIEPDVILLTHIIKAVVRREQDEQYSIPLYTHPVKEQSTNERIEMLKEMVEKSANPVGWIGYHEGHLVSFLQTQEQVDSFLKNTDTAGRVKPVYTHPVEEQDESFDRTASHMAGEYVSHPVKDLEDIDINITWNENSMRDFGKDELAFARAILKKAQER